MGKIFKAVGGLLGLTPPKAASPAAEALQVSPQPIEDTKKEQDEAKKARVALYGTEGGALGAQLSPDSVGGRQTLLGN